MGDFAAIEEFVEIHEIVEFLLLKLNVVKRKIVIYCTNTMRKVQENTENTKTCTKWLLELAHCKKYVFWEYVDNMFFCSVLFCGRPNTS